MTVKKGVEKMRVNDDALDLVFRKARTYSAWLPKPVPDEPPLASRVAMPRCCPRRPHAKAFVRPRSSRLGATIGVAR